MDELNWEYDSDDEEEFEGPADMDAFYQALKIALQIQAQAAAEIESTGQFGVGQ